MKCNFSKCNNPLTGSRKKFCSDKCSEKHHAEIIRARKRETLIANSKTRYCKYQLCGKELPKDMNLNKNYCKGTDCYRKNNALEAKQKRDAKKKNKEIIMVVCANDECNEMLEKHHVKKYHSNQCRLDQVKKNEKAKRAARVAMYDATKKKALVHNGNKKDIIIPEEFIKDRSDIERKPQKEEIKHFSVQWLEDAYYKQKRMNA